MTSHKTLREMMRLAALLFASLALASSLGGCRIVSDKVLAADEKKSPDAFDANAYVAKIWTAPAVAEFKAKAVDLSMLLPAIEADPDKTGKAYGRGGGEGNPWSYEVKGQGKATAIDVASRHGLLTVEIATKDGAKAVDLQIGPVIFGTALRDSLPSVHFGDFVNQIQFAQVSRALNDAASKGLKGAFDAKTVVGKTVTFYGAATAGSASARMSVTPVAIEIGKAAP